MTRRALCLLLLGLPAAADRAVTFDGAILMGEMKIAGDELLLVRGKKESRWLRAEVYFVEKDDGALVWTTGLDARLRGLAHLARAEKRGRLVALVTEALGAKDLKLARRLLDRAESSGFTGADAEKLKRKLEKMEKRSYTRDEKKAKVVRARLAQVEAIHPQLLVDRAEKGGPHALGLLREALRLDPLHDGANRLLKAKAPADFPIGNRTFWLDWQLDLASKGALLTPAGNDALTRARRHWRKDLYGIRAGPIHLITPVQDTRTVGRCLAYGRLTCEVLASIFKTDKPQPRVSSSLKVFLYPSKKEYMTTTGTARRVEDRGFLKVTAGHYSPSEQVSRVVWDRKRDAERRIARVFMHELTHQWVAELNPRYANRELRISSGAPGYWIVEAIATFIQEGRYDVDKQTWALFDSRARSLDVVASLSKQGRLIPWPELFGMDYRKFIAMPRQKNDIRIVRRWQVGAQLMSRARLFYEQSTATFHCLFHDDGGRYRPQLIEYVTSHYTGKKDKLTIQAAFGMTPLDLGRKVEAFARKVAKGWRP